MFFARRTFAWALTAAVLAISPGAHAQPAGSSVQSASSRASLVAERQRLRGELERVNAEIDVLKHSRGMRDDYRLRDRLADAEALARRLTELDARLGANRGATTALPAPADEPRVSYADGPAELDAKADILADQARRLAARGDSLLARAHDLRDRQTLRRRVGQMEHDPFSPLEGSKRRAMAGSSLGIASAPGVKSAPTLGGSPASGTGSVGNTSPGTVTTSEPSSPPAPSAPSLSPAAPAGGHELATSGASLGTPSSSNSASSSPSSTPSGVAVSSPTAAPTPTSGAASDNAALSVQLRDLVDATTLAEIQHLEASAGPGASTDALERAGTALKARAERLRQQAAALRASEHPRAR